MALKKDPPKISVYFVEEEDKPLYDELEQLIKKKKISKNRAILEILREYFKNQKNTICENVSDYESIYKIYTDKHEIQEIRTRLLQTEKELKNIRAEIEELKKNNTISK